MNLSHPTCTKEWYIECEPTYSWNWTCDLVYKIHSIFHAYKHVSYTSNEYWCFPSIWTDDLAFDLTWLSFDQDLEINKIIILWKTVECFAVQGQLLHVYKIHSIFHAYKHVSYTSNEYWCFPSIWTDDLAFDLTWLSFDQDLESTKIIILWKTVECFAVQGQLLHNPWWNLAVFPKILRSYCDVVCKCCLDQKLNVMSIVFSR